MTKSIIDQAVDKFLGWKLPKDFAPDAGISFKAEFNEHTQWPMKHEPVGTNLFTADQAKAMFEHCLGDAIAAIKTAHLAELTQGVEMPEPVLNNYYLSSEQPSKVESYTDEMDAYLNGKIEPLVTLDQCQQAAAAVARIIAINAPEIEKINAELAKKDAEIALLRQANSDLADAAIVPDHLVLINRDDFDALATERDSLKNSYAALSIKVDVLREALEAMQHATQTTDLTAQARASQQCASALEATK